MIRWQERGFVGLGARELGVCQGEDCGSSLLVCVLENWGVCQEPGG